MYLITKRLTTEGSSLQSTKRMGYYYCIVLVSQRRAHTTNCQEVTLITSSSKTQVSFCIQYSESTYIPLPLLIIYKVSRSHGCYHYRYLYRAVKKHSEGTKEQILLEACKLGAARELYEETGIDIRDQLNRLEPATITTNGLECMLKNKCYFHLQLNDKDFVSPVSVSRNSCFVLSI